MPDAAVVSERHGTIVLANTKAESLCAPTAELVGQAIEMLVPERFRVRYAKQRTAVFVAPRARRLDSGADLYGLRKDRTEFPVEISLCPVETDRGPLVWATILDISARRALHASLQSSEERFRLLTSGVTDYAIFMLDTSGNVVTWNDGAQRLKGYRAEEILGQHFSCFYPPEDLRVGKPEREARASRGEGAS